MNKKGQALVEFVLILPVFLFILLAIYDFGMIFNTKNSLENKSNDFIEMFKHNKSIEEMNQVYDNVSVSISNDNEYYKIVVKSSVKITTPGLNQILGNPFIVEVERYLPYE